MTTKTLADELRAYFPPKDRFLGAHDMMIPVELVRRAAAALDHEAQWRREKDEALAKARIALTFYREDMQAEAERLGFTKRDYPFGCEAEEAARAALLLGREGEERGE